MTRTLRMPRGRGGDERGLALVSLLVILSALTILSMGLIVFSTTELQIADNQRNHTNALFTTEAGVAEVVERMSLRPGSVVTVNGSTFDPAIGDDRFNPDPDWRTEMYLSAPGGLPAPLGGETIVATVQPSGSWLHYGDANLGSDPIVIEHKWVDRNLDGIRDLNELVRYDANRFPPENFASGHLVEVITASGVVNGARRQLRAEVTRIPLTVNVTSAITTDNEVDLTGNVAGCGHNHAIQTPANTKIPACYGWELCANRTQDIQAGCLIAVQTTGDDADTGGASDLEGFPAWSDTSSTNAFFDVHEYLGLDLDTWNEVRASPDYTSANDAVNMDGIVIVDGNATSGEKFNGNNGVGLIYINGDADFSGNFVWRGLIFVEGDAVVTGTMWLLGAIIVRGTPGGGFAAGNSTILYSRDAINMFVGGSLGYTTLAWTEL